MTRRFLALATAVLSLIGCATSQAPAITPPPPAPPMVGPPFDLAFLQNDGTTAQVACLDFGLGSPTLLTRGDSSVFGPRWVPRLGRLVVASLATRPATLLAIDPTDGSAERLWANPADDEVPEWRPSEEPQVVYSLPTETGRALVLADAEGRTIRRLTDGTHTDKQPALSPWGSRVAFVSSRSGNDDIWVLDLQTGTLTNETDSPAPEGHPAWGPSSRKLVFYRYQDGDADLYTLTFGDTPTPLAPAPGNDLIGRFSPDGAWLAFGSARSGDWEVYLARADGSSIRRLTTREGFDGDPVWLPPGTCPR